jgi:hypothetical protein
MMMTSYSKVMALNDELHAIIPAEFVNTEAFRYNGEPHLGVGYGKEDTFR